MLVGVKTWAVVYLISNGDLGSIVLFGSFLAWAVYDRITLKRRSDPGAPPIPADGRRRDLIAIPVGDSLGMVMHGLETTVPVTLDMMILQGLAVMRGSRRALVVVDMPFGSY